MGHFTNMEMKARTNNLEPILEFLLKNCTLNKGTDLQTDTYFNTKNGRLKLREGNIENALIYYVRSNNADTKLSDVRLIKQDQKNGIKEILAQTNGIKVVVKKSREIYFINNIKFHLDHVTGLGTFVEIEAIDKDGTYSQADLKQQCDSYIKIFNIKNSELVSNSYSDLTLEKMEQLHIDLQKQYQLFMDKITSNLSQSKIEVNKNHIDHICYRVESMEKYNEQKINLSLLGELLIEAEVGGRSIATYKLYRPLTSESGINIGVIELPAPKEQNQYAEGFEHIEVVIDKNFEEFAKLHPSINFSWDGANKKNNPELRVKFDDNYSVKFHHQSLEEVIKSELLASN